MLRVRPHAALALDNLLPALVWVFLLYMQVVRFDFPPALPNLLLALINTIAIVLFLARRDPVRTAASWEMGVAVLGTFVTALMPEAREATWLSTTVQVVGLILWAGALLALGRSLGLAPADRGLKVRGPYAVVRHPLYASELVFWCGFLMAGLSLQAVAIFTVWWGLQVIRIVREERILEGYEDYRARVRWRVVPGVW